MRYMCSQRRETFSHYRQARPLLISPIKSTPTSDIHVSEQRSTVLLPPSDRVLENGDQVNIRTQPNAKPSRSWLSHVKTAAARNKIRHWFRDKDRADALELGKKFIAAELRVSYLNARDCLSSPKLLDIAKQLNLKNLEELFIRIGNGYESATHVVNLLKPEVPGT